MHTATGTPLRVVVAGGGPAALEGALELQALAGDRVHITLVAPEAWFVYRPLAVAEPFGLGHATRFSLPALATERGFAHVRDAVATVDTAHRRLVTTGGEQIDYDALLIAVGARTADALP